MAPILPLLIAGGALFFALSKGGSKSSSTTPLSGNGGLPSGGPASSTLPGAGMTPPPDVLQAIAMAMASANPTVMNATADQLDAEGWKAQAADLRAAALLVQKATTIINTTGQTLPQPGPQPTGKTQSPPVVLPGNPTVVTPPPTSPTVSPNTGTVIEAPIPTATSNPLKNQASQLALMLSTTKRGSEDKDQVRAFQTANAAGEQKSQTTLGKAGNATADGLYGTTTALTLARDYGIVPPAPFYYPTNPTPAKKAYKTQMALFGASDPQRADEWAHAASSVDTM